ncbi:MAG: FecR domain-containing protein, partial [Hydrocarboniphaga effusa]|nr:FecR domain-containing protein [Hydrocarboniphaga effusa]
EGKSIFELRGEVLVNGVRASEATVIKPGDQVKTGSSSYAIYAVGANAYLLRENSTFDVGLAGKALKQAMRLITGKLLGVFGKRDQRLSLNTPSATIGIRGTGVYAETDPDKTYLCTCYGTTDLVAARDYDLSRTKGEKGHEPEKMQVTAQHHDAAKYILTRPENGKLIVPAPFIKHTDLELMTLEALVGREVPFGLPADQYESPRREY